jgi:hypothetical protein
MRDATQRVSLVARVVSLAPFVLSAAFVAAGVRMVTREPRTGAMLVMLLAGAFFFAVFALTQFLGYRARRRLRRVLRSGDVRSVLHAWAGNLARLPFPETMTPLLTAAAFASYGWVEQARVALQRSERGPAWDAALEHRLFVETLLDTFEGDREGALSKAARLCSLPLPTSGSLTRGRARTLRRALVAFARAFAHVSDVGDMRLLERASNVSPLVHWAMRYAAAVVAIDHGRLSHAERLLQTAPAWPEGSAFHSFHSELSGIFAAKPAP